MVRDPLYFTCKSWVACRLANTVRHENKYRRELAIQGDKLELMALEHSRRFSGLVMGLSLDNKKLRKERGLHMHRLTQQMKLVDAILLKALVDESIFAKPSNFTLPKKKKKLSALVRKQMEEWEYMYDQFTKQMLTAVPELKKALSAPVQASSKQPHGGD
jgi:hypothetical protein